MKLTYRGIEYQVRTVGQATVPTQEIGTYRGTKLAFRATKTQLNSGEFAVLTYRGAQYRSPRYSQSTYKVDQAPIAIPFRTGFRGVVQQTSKASSI